MRVGSDVVNGAYHKSDEMLPLYFYLLSNDGLRAYVCLFVFFCKLVQNFGMKLAEELRVSFIIHMSSVSTP